MSSVNGDRVAQWPRLQLEPARVDTEGPDAGELASGYGLVPDPWQQLVLNSWLGRDGSGRWSALTAGLSIPRQNGKNAIIEMRCLYGMTQLGEKFLHTAHEVKTARKAFKRLTYFFGEQVGDPMARFPELNELVVEVRKTNGQEAIFLDNGGSVEIAARSKNSGRGFTVDVLICDEAQELDEDALEALLPTTSAAPLRNPQWLYSGTPPGPSASGEVFTRIRTNAMGEDDPPSAEHAPPGRLAWHEWSLASADQIDDRDAWRGVNPSLESGRLQWEVAEGERSGMSDDGFLRERGGMWAGSRTPSVIDAKTWGQLADANAVALDPVAYGIDVNPDRTRASIGMSGNLENGRLLLDFVEGREGVDWVVGVCRRIFERQAPRCFVIDGGSPAGSLIKGLEDAGLPVVTATLRDYTRSCAKLYDGATGWTRRPAQLGEVIRPEDQGQDSPPPAPGLTHLGQPTLNRALAMASKRVVNPEGAWAWNRKSTQADITPLVAVTLAIHGLTAEVPKRKRDRTGRAYAF